jgi:hypothetical protein
MHAWLRVSALDSDKDTLTQATCFTSRIWYMHACMFSGFDWMIGSDLPCGRKASDFMTSWATDSIVSLPT